MGDDGLALRIGELAVVRPQDRPGGDGIDADFGAQFLGQGPGQGEQGPLGGRIQGITLERPLGVDVGDIDDGPAPGLEVGGGGLDQKQGRLEIAADQVVPGRLVDLPQGGREEAGGVVDQPIELAEVSDDGLDQSAQLITGQEIGLEEMGGAWAELVQLGGEGAGFGRVGAVVQGQGGAFAMQVAGNGGAHPAGGAGDQDDLVGERGVHDFSGKRGWVRRGRRAENITVFPG